MMYHDSRRRIHSASAEPDYASGPRSGVAPGAAGGRLSRMRDGYANTGGSGAYNASYSQQNGCNITSNMGM